MSVASDAERPKQAFQFRVIAGNGLISSSNFRDFILELSRSRRWLLGSLDYVAASSATDQTDALEGSGGVLEIYSALPPNSLPKRIDRAHFEEIESVVSAIEDFSARTGLAFEFELGGTFVGTIEHGKASRTLQLGLLDEWKKHLT